MERMNSYLVYVYPLHRRVVGPWWLTRLGIVLVLIMIVHRQSVQVVYGRDVVHVRISVIVRVDILCIRQTVQVPIPSRRAPSLPYVKSIPSLPRVCRIPTHKRL